MDFIFPAEQIAKSNAIPVSIAFDTDVSIDGLSNQTFQIKNFLDRDIIWTSDAYVTAEVSASDHNVVILNPGKRKNYSCTSCLNDILISHSFEITRFLNSSILWW